MDGMKREASVTLTMYLVVRGGADVTHVPVGETYVDPGVKLEKEPLKSRKRVYLDN